jgi:hypothetical protein
MNKQKFAFTISLIFIIVVQAACNLPQAEGPDPAATLNALYTQSAQTLEAMATQAAQTSAVTQPALSPTSAIPTYTLIPGFNTPTPPAIKTNTPLSRCDWAAFVSDVTYPDGSTVGRGLPFTKTWRLKNIGTCSWTTSYAIVFVEGESFSAPVATALPGNVNPGQTVDIQINLTAPGKDGSYKGYFKLRNAAGMLFGVGDAASNAFWVDVKVAGTTYAAYDFVANYCDAQWSSNKKNLPCPGMEGDNDGYVIRLDAPKLENGNPAGSPGLMTYPRDTADGYIRGAYPPIKIEDGDRFRSVINCRANSAGCDVIFRLDYQVGNGNMNTLGQWNEAFEGLSYSIDIDLSSLAGYNVKFFLTVLANGNPTKDFAIWIGPQIMRQGTPSSTSKTITLPLVAAESGTVTSIGLVNPSALTVGDNAANEGVEGFLSFDMSGLPSNAVIQSATLKLLTGDRGGQIFGSPFTSLGCLRAFVQHFGTLDASDFVGPGATGAFGSWCNEENLSVEFAGSSLVAALHAELGNARFRFRLQFRDMLSDGNSSVDGLLLSSPITLTVTYTTP